MAGFEIVGYTDTGLVRNHNEDHILVGRFIKNRGLLRLFLSTEDDFLQKYGLLLAVADGIGGEAGGGTASELALLNLEKQFYALPKNGSETAVFIESLYQASQYANENLLKTAQQQPQIANMGSTLAGVCLISNGHLIFHGGDSRVYRYRRPVLKMLTVDDTVAQLAVRTGQMTLKQAKHSQQRHRLTNFLGYEGFLCHIEPGAALRNEDILMISSDGLHDLIEPGNLEYLFNQHSTYLPTLVQKLVNQAFDNGGYDNISLILIRLDEQMRL